MVLVHGHNGAGKTSLLSALELALTGSVPSLERADKAYRRELANYAAGEGSISLRVEGLGDDFHDTDIKLTRSTTRTPGGLSEQAARFYSERCYLAQTTLSQLLSIYGGDDASIDTPLSQFAAELLGLDRLDALQRGLQPARDARNLRPLAPTYRTLEDRRTALAQIVTTATTELDEIRATITDLTARVADADAAVAKMERFDGDGEEAIRAALVEMDNYSRRADELTRSWERITEARSGSGREVLATTASDRDAEAASWLEEHAKRIERLLIAAASHVSDVPRGVTADVGQDVGRLAGELDRLSRAASAASAAADAGERRLKEVDDELVTLTTAVSDLDRGIAELGRDAPDLAAALSSVLPHIHGDECPVCGRNYPEVSDRPLADVLRERIGALTAGASRLAAATSRRATLASRVAELQRERELLVARAPTTEVRLQNQAAAASLSGLAAEAAQLEQIAISGSSILRQQADAVRQAVGWSRSDVEEDVLRKDIATLESQLGIKGDPLAMVAARLSSITEHIGSRRVVLLSRLEHARSSSILREELASASIRRDEAETRLRGHVAARKRADEAFRAAGAVRKSVVRIADVAADARSRVVAEVFNDRLNSLWRDLFVRLAPDEEFVPSFDVPIGRAGRVRPVLKTIHRSGEDGGSPGVMLSSGNLNTAALTLFLALHLSVQPTLPWLVLDDPVQSMDDVHIAHFAALLRTLSKEHGRQILVAVHDRALFDYLALEMSPAFPSDELITIELERSSAGETRYKTVRHGYTERPRIVAAAA
jgi:exonuclease SbcC